MMTAPPSAGHYEERPTKMDQLLSLWVRVQNAVKRDERGAAGVEYGLLVALIAAVIIATVSGIGTKVESGFTTVLNNLP